MKKIRVKFVEQVMLMFILSYLFNGCSKSNKSDDDISKDLTSVKEDKTNYEIALDAGVSDQKNTPIESNAENLNFKKTRVDEISFEEGERIIQKVLSENNSITLENNLSLKSINSRLFEAAINLCPKDELQNIRFLKYYSISNFYVLEVQWMHHIPTYWIFNEKYELIYARLVEIM
jgi:hypothetical protein